MTLKYYTGNFLMSLVYFFVFFYYWYEGEGGAKLTYMLFYSALCCFIYPYSKMAVENTALKFTSQDFWNRGFFSNDVGKSGLLAIYSLFLFIFSPLLVLLNSPFIRKAK